MTMLNILVVCTGNICRSPMTEQLLEDALNDAHVSIRSAGTRARDGMRMPPEAQRLTVHYGGDPGRAERHGSTVLGPEMLRSAHLVVVMGRDHRRELVEMDPTITRRTFTLRELARLVAGLEDETLRDAAARASGRGDDRARLAEILAVIAARRGIGAPPSHPEDDDVVDPYGRSAETYMRSGTQIVDALPAVSRVIRLAASPRC